MLKSSVSSPIHIYIYRYLLIAHCVASPPEPTRLNRFSRNRYLLRLWHSSYQGGRVQITHSKQVASNYRYYSLCSLCNRLHPCWLVRTHVKFFDREKSPRGPICLPGYIQAEMVLSAEAVLAIVGLFIALPPTIIVLRRFSFDSCRSHLRSSMWYRTIENP